MLPDMDMHGDQVRSATGVDVSLPIAGPGSRSYAFIIDWHFRLLLALAWFILASWVSSLLGVSSSESANSTYILSVVIPALTIYLLYHPVLEVLMRGRSPGKRLAGVRIVTRLGGTPTAGALLVRNMFRLIDSMPVFYVVGLVTSLVTAQRVRIGDLAAGTILILDRTDAVQSLERLGALAGQTHLSPEDLEIASDLLLRWKDLGDARRTVLAKSLLLRISSSSDTADVDSLDSTALHSRLEAAIHGEVTP
jgi:uncharacterized RDD family membrane protein YckC